jgi:hypothetical protein
MNRVEGQPLFLKDPNCHCINPRKDFVLNPAAWADPAPGQFGVSDPFYDDYRRQALVTSIRPRHQPGCRATVKSW